MPSTILEPGAIYGAQSAGQGIVHKVGAKRHPRQQHATEPGEVTTIARLCRNNPPDEHHGRYFMGSCLFLYQYSFFKLHHARQAARIPIVSNQERAEGS